MSGYTTGPQQRSPAGRLCVGASSRSTDIDLLISITVTYVDAIRSADAPRRASADRDGPRPRDRARQMSVDVDTVAVISDIHGNLPALNATLERIERLG